MGTDEPAKISDADSLQLGTLIKPHGFRGAAMIHTSTGSDSALNYLDVIYLRKDSEPLTRFEIETAQWMPTGWKIKLKGLDSDTQVEQWRDAKVYANRADLEEPDTGEFYVHDLIGANVVDSDTGKTLGQLYHVQAITTEQDVWWIKTAQGELAIPATSHFILAVDALKKIVRVKNTQDLIPAEDDA
jgi:16S rRNA processing protein RimM